MKRKPPSKEGFCCVGLIVGAHGIRGEVKLHSFTENPLNIKAYGTPVDDRGFPYDIKQLRVTPKGCIAKFAHVPDRNMAETLKGIALYVPTENLPPQKDGDVLFAQLEGARVVLDDGVVFGEVVNTFETGANAVVEVKVPTKKTLVLLPYIDGVVLGFDAQSATLKVSQQAKEFLDL